MHVFISQLSGLFLWSMCLVFMPVPYYFDYFVVIQSLSCVQLFETQWTTVYQASLSFTISWILLKLMMPSNHSTILFSVFPFFSCPQSFPSSWSFPMSWFFASGDQSIGALPSVLSMNIQGWFPLGLTCLILLWLPQLCKIVLNWEMCLQHILLSQEDYFDYLRSFVVSYKF